MLARLLLWLSGADKEYKKVKELTQKDSWINMEENIKKMTEDLNKSTDDFSKKFDEYMKEEKNTNHMINDKKSVVDEIVKLGELKEKGLLTEEEFNEQKKKLLKQ